MRIEVYKDYIIRSDERNFILCKSRGMVTDKKTGKETEQFNDLGYYGTMQNALNGLCEREILASKATTFKELQNDYNKLMQMLNTIGKELKESEVMK